MPKLIRESAELMTLPVGAEAVDNEGDYLHRDTLGWTYRPKGLIVRPEDVATPTLLQQYMPMVVTTTDADARAYLDSPELREKVAIYLAQDAIPGDFVGTADGILAMIKEHHA